MLSTGGGQCNLGELLAGPYNYQVFPQLHVQCRVVVIGESHEGQRVRMAEICLCVRPSKGDPPNNKGFQKAPLGGHLRGGLAEHPFREGACNCNMFTPCDLDWMVGVKNDTLRLLDAPFALAR